MGKCQCNKIVQHNVCVLELKFATFARYKIINYTIMENTQKPVQKQEEKSNKKLLVIILLALLLIGNGVFAWLWLQERDRANTEVVVKEEVIVERDNVKKDLLELQ